MDNRQRAALYIGNPKNITGPKFYSIYNAVTIKILFKTLFFPQFQLCFPKIYCSIIIGTIENEKRALTILFVFLFLYAQSYMFPLLRTL